MKPLYRSAPIKVFSLLSVCGLIGMTLVKFQACGQLTKGKTSNRALASFSGDCTPDTNFIFLSGEINGSTGKATTVLRFTPDMLGVSVVDQIPMTTRGQIRGFGRSPYNGNFFIGDDRDPNSTKFISNLFQYAEAPTFELESDPKLSNVHNSCFLPNGNILIGEFLGNRRTNEYTTDGKFVRVFHTASVNDRSAIVYCFALSNSEVVFSEGDATFGGIVAKKKLVDNQWESVPEETLDFGRIGSERNINYRIWSLGFDGGEYFYIPSFIRLDENGKSAHQGFLRCRASNLDLAQCSDFGQVFPFDGEERIDPMTQIPGTRDLLFSTTNGLWRLNAESGEIVSLGYYKDLFPNNRLVRYIHITSTR